VCGPRRGGGSRGPAAGPEARGPQLDLFAARPGMAPRPPRLPACGWAGPGVQRPADADPLDLRGLDAPGTVRPWGEHHRGDATQVESGPLLPLPACPAAL